MKGIFYVFSGTGNTDKICRAVRAEWEKAGTHCDYVSIAKDCALPDPNEYERIVIGYPVHAFNAPPTVIDFLRKLPPCRGERLVYLVKTSGEPLHLNDGSCAHVYDILHRRGYLVAGEYHYVMPYNMIFRHSDRMAARMWQAARRRIPREAAAMLAGEKKKLAKGPFRRAVSFVFRIEHPAMRMIGKGFHATDACVGCGLCAKNCPQKNIRMANGKPVFGKNCVGCVRCSFLCPEDAIDIGILNGWRVNGRYRFDGEPADDVEICRYCNRSYKRYFAEAEKYPLPAKENDASDRSADNIEKND